MVVVKKQSYLISVIHTSSVYPSKQAAEAKRKEIAKSKNVEVSAVFAKATGYAFQARTNMEVPNVAERNKALVMLRRAYPKAKIEAEKL